MSSHISLKRIFNCFNKMYFNNEVPAETRVIWAPLNGNNGEYQAGTIRIDTTLQGSLRMTQLIVLHEMIHARYPQYGHGKRFHAEVDRLYSAGAYRRLL